MDTGRVPILDSGRFQYPDVPGGRAPSPQGRRRRSATTGKPYQPPATLADGCRGFAENPARYVSINRRDAIQPAFDALLGIADQVLVVERSTVVRAKKIVMGHTQVSARDALHLAVMEQHGIERILSFDSGFDGFPGVSLLS